MANDLVKHLFFHIQKRFLRSSALLSSTPTLPTSGISLSSVEYLVNSCGLPLENALFVSQKFQLAGKNPEKTRRVLEFYKTHHFSDSHVAQLILKRPEALQCRVEENLLPKFDYLVKNGFVGELLPQFIVSNPQILKRSLDSQIKPSFDFLRLFLDSDKKIVTAFMRDPWLLTSYMPKVVMNIEFLMKEGVPAQTLEKLLTLKPRTILLKHDRVVYAVSAVKNLGFEPTNPMFIHALRVIIQVSESTLKEKIEMMKSMGWDEKEIFSAFRRDPLCLACSEEKMKKAIDFYVNTMKLDPQTVISRPRYLRFGFEKRIRPRYNVLKALESKKLIERIKNMDWLTISEKNFLKKYVDKYISEIPNLLEMYLSTKEIDKIGA